MLRRQARLRREYLYQKSKENRESKHNAKKLKIEQSLIQNTYIHGDIQNDAIKLQEDLKYNTRGIYKYISFFLII